LKSETKKEMDYENINEIITLLTCMFMMRILKMFEGRLFITLVENTDRKCWTLEKRRDLKEIATIWNLWIWRKNA